jgi:hypothetical protein
MTELFSLYYRMIMRILGAVWSFPGLSRFDLLAIVLGNERRIHSKTSEAPFPRDVSIFCSSYLRQVSGKDDNLGHLHVVEVWNTLQSSLPHSQGPVNDSLLYRWFSIPKTGE